MNSHRVNVTGGVVRLEDRAEFDRQAKKLPDGEYALILDIPDTIRTYLQNRYYWGGVLEPISKYTGFTPLELHDAFKRKFPPKYGDSTATENTKDFHERIENIKFFALEQYQITIKSPEEWREEQLQKRRLKIGDGVFGGGSVPRLEE